MSIIGLIPSLMEVGKIKIGVKGAMMESTTGAEFRPPKKLDHFIITTNERDEHGDFRIDEPLMESLKKNGRAIKDANGNLIGIPVRLLYNDIDLNFQTRLAAYIGAKCACSGNGEKARTRDGREVKCPCDCLQSDYKGRDKCKFNGTLTCIIEGTEYFGGCHKFRTTGKNSVQNIIGSMTAIQAATCGTLAFLPLLLMVQPKTTTTPDGSITTVYVVAVVFPGGVDKLQEESLKIHRDKMEYLRNMDQMEHYARKQLENTGAVTDDEEKDIAEEFYPEAIKDQVVETKPESKDVKAEREIAPPADDEKEPSEVTVSTGPVTAAQLKKMAGLKKDLGLDKESWEKLLVPYDVPTAKQMTTELANKFLLELENELVPF